MASPKGRPREAPSPQGPPSRIAGTGTAAPSEPRDPGRHLAIVGPTASGKSAVALALAERRIEAGLPTEIVSCDSMQVYRGMDVGTAKPTATERAAVPHHLIDLVDPTEHHDVSRFADAAREVLGEIESRGARAVVVGGTGLYVRAVIDDFRPPPHFPDITAELEAEPDTEALTRRLAELDPEALSHIPSGNRRRIVRALEVTIGTGRPFSSHGRRFDEYPPTPFVLAGLWPERAELNKRIEDRLRVQMAEGMLQEAEELHALGGALSRTAAQALGYRELLAHLRGESTLEDAIGRAFVRTRRFAVRQQRWFGRDPRITWFDPPGSPADAGRVAASVDELWSKRAVAGVGSVATVGHRP